MAIHHIHSQLIDIQSKRRYLCGRRVSCVGCEGVCGSDGGYVLGWIIVSWFVDWWCLSTLVKEYDVDMLFVDFCFALECIEYFVDEVCFGYVGTDGKVLGVGGIVDGV